MYIFFKSCIIKNTLNKLWALYSQEGFSIEEHEAVQQVLRQRLGPEFISQRTGAAGVKVYLLVFWCMMFAQRLQCKNWLSLWFCHFFFAWFCLVVLFCSCCFHSNLNHNDLSMITTSKVTLCHMNVRLKAQIFSWED